MLEVVALHQHHVGPRVLECRGQREQRAGDHVGGTLVHFHHVQIEIRGETELRQGRRRHLAMLAGRDDGHRESLGRFASC